MLFLEILQPGSCLCILDVQLPVDQGQVLIFLLELVKFVSELIRRRSQPIQFLFGPCEFREGLVVPFLEGVLVAFG